MAGICHAAAQSGVSIETIRYYERSGVVPKPPRTAAGHRNYSGQDIGRLRFIKRCRDLGFPLTDAQSLLGLTDGSMTTCAEAKQIAEGQRMAVQAKITQLQKIETALSRLTEQCSDSANSCPILLELLADEQA
ncbi:MAG: MerR family transcriptional regulator [Hyphomicrobiales bacterium]